MLDLALTAVASILFIVDPVGTIPAYLVMTEGDAPEKRRRTALGASVIATATMAGFAAAGSAVFRALGLTLAAFQIAGGVILFLVALDMIRAQRQTQEGPEELSEGRIKDDVMVTPLAIPMLAGPAALSTVATLMSQTRDLFEELIVYGAILLTGVVSYVTLRLAEPVNRALGKTGIHVLSRILGLVLAGIAVQFVLNGLRAAGALPWPGERGV